MTGVNLLWHFHQPDYRHPESGIPVLPWVRLHAAKGYSDLLAALRSNPAARVTVNFSGVLLDQLAAYCNGLNDSWAELSAQPAAELDSQAATLVWQNFFSANHGTMIRSHPRYAALLELKLRASGKDGRLAEPPSGGSLQDLTDLLVWFNLAWIGFHGQRRSDVRALVVKGRDYALSDQLEVLAIQRELAAELLPGYRALAEAGQIELSVTPLNHPILPLLINLAGEGHSAESDPLPDFEYAGDAREQLIQAQRVYQLHFGREPTGMWPAEGSVSDAALHAFAAAGVRWIATDQANLPQAAAQSNPLPHMQPWRWSQDGQQLHVFFRDTRLSDNIGFEYSRWQPQAAAQHLAHMLGQLGEQSGLACPVITVALDGENPWEAYPDGGQSFLSAMFAALEARPDLVCQLPTELLARSESPSLDSIGSGSWIYGNFDIWTRHSDTRRAWRLLATTRHGLERHWDKAEVRRHLLAAEGSDWFWWYGDDFTSEQAAQFDELFRGHLIAACVAAGARVPPELYEPITPSARQQAVPLIQWLLEPVADGRISSFYEWRGALRLGAFNGQSSMARGGSSPGAELWYGFSRSELWLRLDPAPDWLAAMRAQGGVLEVSIACNGDSQTIELLLGGALPDGVQLAIAECIELGLPLDSLEKWRGRTVRLGVVFRRADGRSMSMPAAGAGEAWVITDDYAASLWSA